MHAKHVQGIIVAQCPLQLGGRIETTNACGNADIKCTLWPHRAGSRGNGNQTGHGAGGDTQNAGLAMYDPFNRHPGNCCGGGGDLSNQHGHACTTACGNRRSGIETEPANPQQGGTDHRISQVMGRHRCTGVAFALAQHNCSDECGNPGVDMHHRATGKIDYAPVPKQSTGTCPYHVNHGQIANSHPQSHEYHHGGEFHALRESTHNQGRCNDRECHLKGGEYGFRNRSGHRIYRDAGHERVTETTDNRRDVKYSLFHTGHIEGNAITIYHPDHRHQAGDGETLHHYRKHVFTAHHACIKQGKARYRHHQYQHGCGNHPGSITGIQFLGRRYRRKQHQRSRCQAESPLICH